MTIAERVESVRLRLQQHKGKYMEIAIATKINYHWVAKFSNGHLPNPGLTRVAAIDKYLADLPVKEIKSQPVDTNAE
jgi:hypothetical protein